MTIPSRLTAAFAALMSACWLTTAFAAVEFSMVADTDPSLASLGSDPKGFRRIGDQVYFTATTPITGTELFALDALPAGARLVTDIAPNGASSRARLLGQAGGKLIVGADLRPFYWDSFSTQFQIVAVDPVTGIYAPLTQLGAHWAGNDGRFAPIAEFAGRVAIRDTTDGSIWASDGTPAGTQRIYGPGGSAAQPFCAMHDRLVFTVRRQNATELWISNGTPGGSGIIAQLPASLGEVRAVSRGDGCYLLQQNTDNAGFNVWLTNGTAEGTGIIKTLATPGTAELYLVGQTPLVFLKSDPVSKLVRLDSDTPLWSGTAWYEDDGVVSNGVLLLSMSTNVGERTLITDGTPEGTRNVTYQGGVSMPWHRPRWHPSENGYVIVNENVSYRVDLATAQAFWVSGVPTLFMTQGDTVAFGGAVVGIGQDSSNSPSNIGNEVWRSDGTTAGTYPLADVAVATAGGARQVYSAATARGGVLIYSADEETPVGVLRRSLWRTDGTPAGTRALSRSLYGSDSASLVRRFGEGAIFMLERDSSLWDLRRVNADFTTVQPVWNQTTRITSLETTDLAAFFLCNPHSWSEPKVCALRPEDVAARVVHSLVPFGSYQYLGSLGDIGLFFADYTLWRSDGTTAGTTQISSTLRGTTSGGSERLGNRLLFGQCDDGAQNCGLYASDGTPAGSGLVRTINGAVRHMARLGDRIVFVTDPGNQLWVSDGTAAGTLAVTNLQAPLHTLTSTGHRLHMVRQAITTTTDYLVSDGTAAGTAVVPMPPGLSIDAWAQPTVVDRDTVLFRCALANAQHVELCSMNGDGGSAQLVADFYEGPQSSLPTLIGRAGGAVYYSIDDGRHGAEPWRFVGDVIFADRFQP